MDGHTKWGTIVKTNQFASALNGFLHTYINPQKGDDMSNICNQCIGQNYIIPLDDEVLEKFFEYIKRIEKIVLHFSERQYYSYTDEFGNKQRLNSSCLELDFDIYQDTQDRIPDDKYTDFTNNLAYDLDYLLDLDSCKIREFYVAVLRKDAVRRDKNRWKESCHIRIFLKMEKPVKTYIVKYLMENKSTIESLGVSADSLDKMCVSVPVMLIGSAKAGSEQPHGLHLVYYVKKLKGITATIAQKEKFNHPRTLSLTFDSPVINKPQVYLKKIYEIELEPEKEIQILKKDVSLEQQIVDEADQLAHQDCEAEYYRSLLKILNVSRATDYASWKTVILILARKSKLYKPLAVEFSLRCPEKFYNGGIKAIDSLFDWVDTEPPGHKKTIGTLITWAKDDNKEEYQKIADMSLARQLFKICMTSCGSPNETQLARLLHIVYGRLFITDIDPLSNDQSLKNRVWYEFVLEKSAGDLDSKSLFKWRCEKQYPDQLDTYISDEKFLIKLLNNFISNIDENLLKSDNSKSESEFYAIVKKNMNRTIHSLGKPGVIGNIITRCAKLFRCRGFSKLLDRNGDFSGVLNGVLRLQPNLELIQEYHEIPISRCMDATAILDETEDMKFLEAEIRRLFCEDEDAFLYIMCYLASTLDGNKKDPKFFIWLGEGSNGKSFLLEMHIATLGHVVDMGYAAKCNINFFTDYGKVSGPDSEKASLKHARFVYTSETEPGVCLLIAKIKEITSETISGNEKFQKQDMFAVNAHFTFCSNNDPRITGSDHGTWRRLDVYNYKLKLCADPDPNNVYEWKDNDKFAKEFPKSPRWRSAYLGILIKYYRIFKDKFGMSLKNIPCPTIRRETEKYRNEQDTINRFITERIEKTDCSEDVIKLDDIVQKYQDWYKLKIKNTVDAANIIAQQLMKTDLKKYKKVTGKSNIVSFHSHKFLDLSQNRSSDMEYHPPHKQEDQKSDLRLEVKKPSNIPSLEEQIESLENLELSQNLGQEEADSETTIDEDNIIEDDLDIEIVELPESIRNILESNITPISAGNIKDKDPISLIDGLDDELDFE